MIKFSSFITEQTDFQKKDFSVEYGKYDIITKLTYKGKHVRGIAMSVPEYSKMELRTFDYSKPRKHYISSFRRSEIVLDKELWNNAKELKHVKI